MSNSLKGLSLIFQVNANPELNYITRTFQFYRKLHHRRIKLTCALIGL
jgi:hypothetical protein